MKKLGVLLAMLFLALATTSLAKDTMPWSDKEIRNSVKAGNTLDYVLSEAGSDGAMKKYDFQYEVIKVDGDNIELKSRTTDPADGSQIGDGSYDNLFSKDGTSPYFSEMRPKLKILRTEKIQVPAGSFDCTVVEMKNMFGETKTVWMINDKPGVYAKVIQGKQTFELK